MPSKKSKQQDTYVPPKTVHEVKSVGGKTVFLDFGGIRKNRKVPNRFANKHLVEHEEGWSVEGHSAAVRGRRATDSREYARAIPDKYPNTAIMLYETTRDEVLTTIADAMVNAGLEGEGEVEIDFGAPRVLDSTLGGSITYYNKARLMAEKVESSAASETYEVFHMGGAFN